MKLHKAVGVGTATIAIQLFKLSIRSMLSKIIIIIIAVRGKSHMTDFYEEVILDELIWSFKIISLALGVSYFCLYLHLLLIPLFFMSISIALDDPIFLKFLL